MLGENRVDEETAWPEDEDEGVLGTDRGGVLRVALDSVVHDGVFVLVLEETEDEERVEGIVGGEDSGRDVGDVEDDSSSGLLVQKKKKKKKHRATFSLADHRKRKKRK